MVAKPIVLQNLNITNELRLKRDKLNTAQHELKTNALVCDYLSQNKHDFL